MAFWNAPVADQSHARNASRAALGMLRALDELNRGRAAQAAARGEVAAPVRVGIGLNTGACASAMSAHRSVSTIRSWETPSTWHRDSRMRPRSTDCRSLRASRRPRRAGAGVSGNRYHDPARQRSARANLRPAGRRDGGAHGAVWLLRTAIDVLIGALLANDRTAAQTKLEECGALDWPGLGTLLEVYRARLS